MKYWRGYLVALVLAAVAWALRQFASAHAVLVDMVYPYVTRLILSYLADWSSGVDFCIWQMCLLVLIALLLASIVVMIIRKWNPIRWFGWVLAAVAFLFLLNTGIYGLNTYAGPLAEDVRLDVSEYTVSELIDAATYYRDQANTLCESVGRSNNEAQFGAFADLAEQAGEGFYVMTYAHSASVLSGTRTPVKELHGLRLTGDKAGTTVGITGESAVNPDTPDVALPWIICREMAHRMSIYKDSDANLAAYLVCLANSRKEFQYSANLIAYHFCLEALKTVNTSTAISARQSLESGEAFYVQKDLETYNDFFGRENRSMINSLCNQLVSWHRQYIVIPAQGDGESAFDPMDPSQVDLTGIVNAKTNE